MKKIIILMASVALTTMVSAQMTELTNNTNAMQVYGVGLRVGAGSFRQNGDDLSAKMGINGAVDGVYTYYFKRSKKASPFWGIRTGVSVAYGQNKVNADEINQSYTLIADNAGSNVNILYNTKVTDVEETNRQLSVEVPIMASMLYKQLFANLGVRVGIPVMSKYKQTIGTASIAGTVSDDDFEVVIPDKVALGKVEETSFNDKLDAASFKMSLAFEGGYVFVVGGNWLSVGAYFNMGLVSNYDGGSDNLISCDVSSIPATVTVNSLTKACSDKMADLNFGVKASFCWHK